MYREAAVSLLGGLKLKIYNIVLTGGPCAGKTTEIGKVRKYLESLGYNVINYGTDSTESADFPDYAKKLGLAVLNNEVKYGIAICGTGIGMSITLSKMKGVYCAKVSNPSEATLSKAHNNANCIAISEELDEEIMLEVVHNFIETPFTNISKYVRRNNMIKEIENSD